MKKHKFLALLSAVLLVLISISCSDDNYTDGVNNLKPGQVVMKVNPEFSGLKNRGSLSVQVKEITIDWGDGTVETFIPNGTVQTYQHEYADMNLKKFTLNTENLIGFNIHPNYGNYRKLYFGSCPDLTDVDISKCTALETLSVDDNQLTSLDVSKCTQINVISIFNNHFTALELNNLFVTLPVRTSENAWISITDNSGTDECDRNVAQNKG